MSCSDARQNFHFKDELAYTEDDVLIHKIFFDLSPIELFKPEVLKYVKSFGKVKYVRWGSDECDKKKCLITKCLVNYSDARSAASALKTPETKNSSSNSMRIYACDSWEQPSVSSPVVCQSNAEELDQACNSLKLIMLNDDCLECIFKKLQLKDQVRLAMTCQRLRNVFEMVCKAKYKTYEMNDALTLWEIREFLLIAGPHIEALLAPGLHKDRDRIIDFISTCCPNIKKLNLSNSKITSSSKLVKQLQNCTVLELSNCGLVNDDIKVFKVLVNLQFLSLGFNSALSGKYIKNLTTVTDLVLCVCEKIKSKHFIAITKSLKGLKSLDIKYCVGLNRLSVSTMAQNCHRLQSLKISYSLNVDYTCVACLPSLIKLELCSFFVRELAHQFLSKLAEHKANQLEALTIETTPVNIDLARQIGRLVNLKHLSTIENDRLTDECLLEFSNLKNLEEIDLTLCDSISNEGLLHLMQSCPKLEKVNIRGCTDITDQFVLKVVRVLKSRQAQRGKVPCLFLVSGSAIRSEVKNDVDCAIEEGLLQLDYSPDPDRPINDDSHDSPGYFYDDTMSSDDSHPFSIEESFLCDSLSDEVPFDPFDNELSDDDENM